MTVHILSLFYVCICTGMHLKHILKCVCADPKSKVWMTHHCLYTWWHMLLWTHINTRLYEHIRTSTPPCGFNWLTVSWDELSNAYDASASPTSTLPMITAVSPLLKSTASPSARVWIPPPNSLEKRRSPRPKGSGPGTNRSCTRGSSTICTELPSWQLSYSWEDSGTHFGRVNHYQLVKCWVV